MAIMLPNLLQYPIALFGAQRAGMVVVNTNPLYTARELEHQLKDSGATAIVVLENFAHTLEEVTAAHRREDDHHHPDRRLFPAFKRMLTNLVVKHVKKMVPEWHLAKAIAFTEALAAGRAQELEDVSIGLDDLAFLQYTGGTTGVAKGAMLTQANMVANLQQVAAWIAPRPARRQGSRSHSAAAVPRLCTDLEPGVHEDRRPHRADHQPARLAGLRRDAEEGAGHRDDRCQHAVQRAAQRAGLRRTEPARAEARVRRRHGGAARGGGALEAGHRRAAGRGLRPDRDGAGRDLQSAEHQGLDRQHRRADSFDRGGDPRRRRQGRCRSARWARSRSAVRR